MAKKLTQLEAIDKLTEMQHLSLILLEQARPASTKSWNGQLLVDALRGANYEIGQALMYIKELPE